MYDDRQVYREIDEITAENSLHVDVITLCLFPGSSHSIGAGQNGTRLSIEKEGTVYMYSLFVYKNTCIIYCSFSDDLIFTFLVITFTLQIIEYTEIISVR